MRRKTFEVLFEPGAGMAAIAKQPSLWRSAFYFTLSFSFFGVATNCWLLDSPLDVRFGIIIATVLIAGTALTLYGFLLHGIMETLPRGMALERHGTARGLRCAGGRPGRAYLPFGLYDVAFSAAHAGSFAGGQDGF